MGAGELTQTEAADLDDYAREQDVASLLMRIVNGSAPVRDAAHKAILDILEERENAEAPVLDRLVAYIRSKFIK